MTEQEYFDHPAVSNSRLKSFHDQLHPTGIIYNSEEALRFGKLYDRRVTAGIKEYSRLLIDIGEPGDDERITAMYAKLCKDAFAMDVLMRASFQVPKFRTVSFRYNGISFSLSCKCLFDFFVSSFGGDLKTFAGKTRSQFMNAVNTFDWIPARVFYMLVAETRQDFIIGQGKEHPYPVYNLIIKHGDEKYKKGLAEISRKAYEYFMLGA